MFYNAYNQNKKKKGQNIAYDDGSVLRIATVANCRNGKVIQFFEIEENIWNTMIEL